jgi:hypothetical protein
MNRANPLNGWLHAIPSTISIFGLLLLAAACFSAPATGRDSTFVSPPGGRPILDPAQRQGTRPFYSQLVHAEVVLPPGWVGVEGSEQLTPHISALAAFNSWGGADYWAQAVGKGCCSHSYGGQDVLDQLPAGGAYVVLVDQGRMPGTMDGYVEHTGRGLAELWGSTDCRDGDTLAGVNALPFCKWVRCYTLTVHCAADVSDATADAVDALIASWQFDPYPIGDTWWATQQAISLLPAAAEPALFSPIDGQGYRWIVPGETLETRLAETAVEENVVTVVFSFRWQVPLSELGARQCPEDSCHWWRVEVGPSGAATLVAEGGAPLP